MSATNFIMVLLFALMMHACAPSARDTSSGVTTTALNLREGPSTSWTVVTIIPKGAQIEIISRIDDWLQVSYGRHAGYVAARYVNSVETLEPDAAPGAGQSEKFLPAHRKILEETGWFEYVNNNIDVLEYYDYPSFDHPDGPAVGLSFVRNGRRVAQIAVKDMTAEEVAQVLAHEAGHLVGVLQIGTQHSEDVAQAVEAQFRRDLEATRFRSGYQERYQ